MKSLSASQEKRAIALSSVGAAIFLTGFKLLIGIQTNSLGILSEAAHSALDLIAALMTFFAVIVADKPPDEEHNYGHGKMENISALGETILLIITCGWIIWEAVERLFIRSTHVEATFWGFFIMGTAIIIDISRSRALSRVAKKHHSQALEADALHFSSDVWSSLTVIGGLIFVSLGYPTVDAIAAIIVALIVLFVSYRLGRRTVDALMDRVPAGLSEKVEAAIKAVHGVEKLISLRVRPSGARVFIDVTVGIRRTIPFEQAHKIMEHIERAVHSIDTAIDVIVHADPLRSDDETIVDRIQMIVANKGLRAAGNLEVHYTNGKYLVNFTIEYQKGKAFVEAHTIASELEEEIRAEIPAIEKVTIHMEEYSPSEIVLSDVTKIEQKLRDDIRRTILENKNFLACTDLTLLQEGTRYRVNLVCTVGKSKTVEDVHEVLTEMEAHLYKKFKQLRRITIHAEPG
ncbi:MAG: cation diffusion facilitator family transporter [Bacteroidota bacterium]